MEYLVKILEDITSSKKNKSTKKDADLNYYAHSGSYATVIAEHGDVLICEETKISGTPDQRIYKKTGHRFPAPKQKTRKV